MVFRVFFCLAVSDCYLNGPCVREEEKYVAVFFSVLGLLVNAQWAFLMAVLAWFAVFFRAEQQQQHDATVETTKEKEITTPTPSNKKEDIAPPPTTSNLPICPVSLVQRIDASLVQFHQNRVGDVTCDGQQWELMSTNKEDVIHRAVYPGQSFYRWRVQSVLVGTFEGIIGEMFDFSKRCKPAGWDSNLAKGEMVKEFANGYRIVLYSSNPVFGGVVSGREFLEARVVKKQGQTYMMSGFGVEEKELGFPVSSRDKKLTQGKVFPGGGFYMEPVDASLPSDQVQSYRYQLVANSALGGWIPTGTINSATASVLAEVTELTRKHMKQTFAPPN